MGGSSSPKTTQVSNLTPQQGTFQNIALGQAIAGLQDGIAPYSGEIAATASPMQESEFGLINQLMQGSAPGQSDYTNALSGILNGTSSGSQALNSLTAPWDPTQATSNWQQQVGNPAMLNWNQNTLPGLKESFAAYDAAGGGGAAKTITDQAVNLQTGLASSLGQYLQSDQTRANANTLSAGQSLNSSALQAAGLGESNLMDMINQFTSAGNTQYGIKQNQDTASYNQWLQMQAYNNPWLSVGLQQEQIPAFTNVVTPGQSSGIAGMLGGAGSAMGGLSKLLPFLKSSGGGSDADADAEAEDLIFSSMDFLF